MHLRLPRTSSLSLLLLLPAIHAQSVLTPSPDRTGTADLSSAVGAEWGPYKVTNSFETGYRFTTVGGDAGLFRSVEKNGLYRYDMTWRRNDYFNPALLSGASDTLKNTRRTVQDHDIELSLSEWAKLKL